MKKLLIFCLCYSLKALSSPLPILVGSTFDYPPLTYIENHQYMGHDIEIIQNFAKNNQLDIKFIPTQWQTLNQDLLEQKFAIAVGGISINPTRQQLFLLSKPIDFSQKVVLMRCNNLKKFNTTLAINQPTTKIVENKGGTNQSVAEASFPKAQLLIVDNNQLPFIYLIKNKADVMLTDSIEAKYVTQKKPQLCFSDLHNAFPQTAKVFLFNKTTTGQKLQQQFDQWWLTNYTKYNKN